MRTTTSHSPIHQPHCRIGSAGVRMANADLVTATDRQGGWRIVVTIAGSRPSSLGRGGRGGKSACRSSARRRPARPGFIERGERGGTGERTTQDRTPEPEG